MQITRGRVFVQRIYDVADEIDLVRAEQLLTSSSRRQIFMRSAKQIRLPHPPIELSLGQRPAPVADVPACELTARIYDLGAIAVTFAIDMPTPLDAEGLVAFGARIMPSEDAFAEAGRAIAEELVGAMKSACKIQQTSRVTEDYTIFRIYATEPRADADSLTQKLDLARLLLGETGPISQRERSQQSHAVISYSPDELVVIDWNSALVYDPSSSTELGDLLELTSMQLLELRAYDDIVGNALQRIYAELDRDRVLFQSTKYGRLSREIMRMVIDFTEMSDRVENSLRTLGDSWFARVHRAAVQEFDIPSWQRLLDQKLEVLRQINQLLVDQIASRISFRLEGAIVALIVLEIFLALLKVT
jgi:hypothetical protein